VETNIGLRLDRRLRTGASGAWWSACTAGGHPLGLLHLEPALVAQPAALDRLAAAVAAVRDVNPSGVLRTTELVVDGRRAWLVVAAVPEPTLADLLAARLVLPPGAAAGIAVDIAQALRDLHAAGLGHGDLAADTVVLTPSGSAALIEAAILAAVRDEPTDAGRDAVAWSSLVRAIAASSTAPEAELLLRAAATAAAGDLPTATRRLAADATHLDDFAGRESLASTIPGIAPAPPAIPAQRPAADRLDGAVRLRFGRGVPDGAILAARTPLAPRPERRSAPRPASRPSLRAIQVAVIMAVLLLGAGLALWLLLLLR
jgi:tRNA A-37 threonylcarbamoyl transferase component Bud32